MSTYFEGELFPSTKTVTMITQHPFDIYLGINLIELLYLLNSYRESLYHALFFYTCSVDELYGPRLSLLFWERHNVGTYLCMHVVCFECKGWLVECAIFYLYVSMPINISEVTTFAV